MTSIQWPVSLLVAQRMATANAAPVASTALIAKLIPHGLVFNPRLLLSTVLWVQAYRISLSIHSLSVLPLLAVS